MDPQAWKDFAKIVEELEKSINCSVKKNYDENNQKEKDEKSHFSQEMKHEIRKIVREEIKNFIKENNNVGKKILEYKKVEHYI